MEHFLSQGRLIASESLLMVLNSISLGFPTLESHSTLRELFPLFVLPTAEKAVGILFIISECIFLEFKTCLQVPLPTHRH